MPPNSTYIAPDNVNPLKYVQSEETVIIRKSLIEMQSHFTWKAP